MTNRIMKSSVKPMSVNNFPGSDLGTPGNHMSSSGSINVFSHERSKSY